MAALKPARPRVVAIVGAESTGKTALAQALAERLGAPWVAEVLRAWCDRHARTPRRDEQAGIAREQARRIAAAAATHPLVVADTTPLQTAVYSRLVFGDGSLEPLALAWQRRHVGLTLLAGLDLPWRPDGLQRDGPQVQAPVDRLLRAALDAAALPYAVVYGHSPARLDAALRAVEAAGLHARAPLGSTAPAETAERNAMDRHDPHADAAVPGRPGVRAVRGRSEGPAGLPEPAGARWRPACAECLDPLCERIGDRTG